MNSPFKIQSSGAELHGVLFNENHLSATGKENFIIVHGFAEHSARYSELAKHLIQAEQNVFSFDFRGHGLSSGKQGHIDTFNDYLNDLNAAIIKVEEIAPNKPLNILAHSMGGLVLLKFLKSHSSVAKNFKHIFFSNPYLDVAIKVPAWKTKLAHFLGAKLPKISLPTGMPLEGISSDNNIVQAYKNDPLIFSFARAGWFVATSKIQEEIRNEPPQGFTNIIFMHSDADPIASPHENLKLAQNFAEQGNTIWHFNGLRHEILNEKNRHEIHQKISNHLNKHIIEA